MSQELHDEGLIRLQRLAGPDGLEKVMNEKGLDLILAASESTLVTFAACAKWPIACVPLGNLTKNDQPFGFFAVAGRGREDTLFKFMGAFHKTFPGICRPEIFTS
jgi:amidase